MRRELTLKALIGWSAIVCALLLSAPARADQTLPSVQVGSLSTPIDPSTAYSYYSGVGLTSNARTVTNDPEIVELARALHNDPDLIYEWVRNNVELELRFGLAKGARGAAIDKSGTAFDQAHLMVELLRASGITATYQFGTITLTGQQFTDWTGISNADAANAILASGGIPASVSGSGSSISSVTLMHLWLKATIGGTQYSFDPAYKPHTFKTGIDVGTAMGFNGSTFVSNALSGSTSDTANSIPKLRQANVANVWSGLSGYAQTLLTHLKTNMPLAEIDDVIGGQRITPYTGGPLRQTSLPYSASVSATFANDVPNSLRTTLRVRFDALDATLYADEFYGKLVTSGMTPAPELPLKYSVAVRADNAIVASAARASLTDDVTLDINHPYAASSGAYMDAQTVQTIPTTAYHALIVYGFGAMSAEFGVRMTEKTGGWRDSIIGTGCFPDGDPDALAQGSADCFSFETDSGFNTNIKAWTAWVAQATRLSEIYSRVGGSFSHHHHSVGTISNYIISRTDARSIADMTVKINIESGVSLESKSGDAAMRRAALAGLVSGMSTLEGSVSEQAGSSKYPVSVASKMDWVNRFSTLPSGSDWVYHADASNWQTVKAQLLADYKVSSTSSISQVIPQAEAYINAGYSIVIPRSSNLGPGVQLAEIMDKESPWTQCGQSCHELIYYITVFRQHLMFRQDAWCNGQGQCWPYSSLYPGSLLSPAFPQYWPYESAEPPSYENAAYAPHGFSGRRSRFIASSLLTAATLLPVSDPLAPHTVIAVGVSTYAAALMVHEAGRLKIPPADERETAEYRSDVDGELSFEYAIEDGSRPAKLTTISNLVETYSVEGPDRGAFIIAYKSDDSSIAYVTLRQGTADKGGGGQVETDPKKIFSPDEKFLEQQYEAKAKSYDVDLQSGNLTYKAPADLVAGNGDFPYSLSFQRSFRAGWGGGWRHNWESDITISGDGLAAMGEVNAQAAAEAIVLAWTQIYLAPQAQTASLDKLRNHIVAGLANMWWAEKIATNTVTLKVGVREWSFVRLADGAYAAPPGDATTITTPSVIERQFAGGHAIGGWITKPNTLAPVYWAGDNALFPNPAGTAGSNPRDCTSYGSLSQYQFTMREKDQTLWTFDFKCAGRAWDADPHGGHSPGISKTGFRLTSMAFPYGVTVSLSYATGATSANAAPNMTFYLSRVANNLGRSIDIAGFSSPTIKDTTNNGTGREAQIAGSFCEADYDDPDDGTLPPICQSIISSVTDPLGNVTRYTSFAVTPAASGAKPYAINSQDDLPWALPQHLAQVFYPIDTTTPSFSFAYDHLGRLKATHDALNHTWAYRIANGRRGSVTDPTDGVSATVYDDRGLVIASIDALGNKTISEFDPLRRVSKVTLPEGNSKEYAYDAKSNVTQTTMRPKPNSSLDPIVSSATYDSTCNVPLTETDALSRTTTYTINTTTCLTLTTTGPAVGSSSPVTTTAYDSYGHVTSITDPTGLVTTYSYNSTTGNLESAIVDPGTSPHIAATTVIAYDTFDNITSITDPRGNVHTATYDLARRLTQYTAPTATGAVTKWTYDNDGLITKIERATSDSGNPWAATNYTYWPTGRVKTMTDADGRVTRYDYDAANRPQITTDPELRRVFNEYDLVGRVTKEIRAWATPLEEDYATYTYSANGQKLTVADARTNTTTYAFDGYDRLITTTFPDTTYEAATYDANGNLLTKRNRAGVTLTFTFDALDRMATKVMPLSGGGNLTTTWTYDLAGRVTDLADSAGYDLAYGFDTAKRITSVARQVPGLTGTQTVSYQYDAGGNRTRVTWPDAYYVQYQFDALNRMTTASENGTYLLATYTYDKLSRRAGLVYGNGAHTSYSHTQQGDLTTLVHNWLTSGGAATGNTFTHTFTKAHQLASVSASDTTHLWEPAVYQTNAYASANNLNQYTQVTFGAAPASTITHDATGNVTSDGVLTMTYDAENRLLTADRSGMSATYGYDPVGRRAKAVVNSTATFFLDDGDEEIGDYDSSGSLLRRYITGPGTDQPIAMIGTGGSPTRDYFHTDRMGSTVAMTDNSDHVSQGPFTYDAYGQSSQTGGVPFRFTGRRLDPETGLYYYRARYYSAALGRFLQTDPVGYQDQMNLYAYVGNDPANRTDSSGMYPDDRIQARNAAMADLLQNNPEAADALTDVLVDQIPGAGEGKSIAEIQNNPSLGSIAAAVVGILPGGDLLKGPIKQVAKLFESAAKGKAGEAITRAKLGDSVAGEQVTFITSDGTRTRTDFVTTDRGIVETKTGNSPLTEGQAKLEADVKAGRQVTPVGGNAAGAGLKPGQPTRMGSCHVDRVCP